jgi:regulator of protease activity HflC (stomatin/prohibitin superfamily)
MAGISPAIFFLIIFLIIIAATAIKILREYERGVIFRWGRLKKFCHAPVPDLSKYPFPRRDFHIGEWIFVTTK